VVLTTHSGLLPGLKAELYIYSSNGTSRSFVEGPLFYIFFTCQSVCCVTTGSTVYNTVPVAICDINSAVCTGYIQVSGTVKCNWCEI